MERRILTKHQQALQKAERVNILAVSRCVSVVCSCCYVTDAFIVVYNFRYYAETKTFVDFGNYCHGGNSFKYDSL